MDEKKYLTEENYERGKKKLKTIAIIILLVGILGGGSLITFGIIKINNNKSSGVVNQRTESVIQADINELNQQIIDKEYECDSLDMESSSWYEDRVKCSSEVNTLRSRLSDLKSELWKIQSGFNDTETSISNGKYIPLFMIGAFVIISSCMLAVFIYIVSKRREITAFTTQQVMPVAKEGIEEIAPTVGNAVGEIAKGIKNGLKDDDKE